jgi:hypothetical protein
VTAALGTAIGLPSADLTGITAGGTACTLGTAGCYDAMITITNAFSSTPLYYRTGTITPDEYDFYSVVEHETDEVLGTASCIDTNGALTDGCGDDSPSAADLFRYLNGSRVLINATPGAYFSYNGGLTNGANGAVYNTLPNGDDYGDFISGCPTSPRVQDAVGCPGFAGLNITNDGGAEINILDAVGYNLAAVPEPSFYLLVGAGLTGIVVVRRLRNRRA